MPRDEDQLSSGTGGSSLSRLHFYSRGWPVQAPLGGEADIGLTKDVATDLTGHDPGLSVQIRGRLFHKSSPVCDFSIQPKTDFGVDLYGHRCPLNLAGSNLHWRTASTAFSSSPLPIERATRMSYGCPWVSTIIRAIPWRLFLNQQPAIKNQQFRQGQPFTLLRVPSRVEAAEARARGAVP